MKKLFAFLFEPSMTNSSSRAKRRWSRLESVKAAKLPILLLTLATVHSNLAQIVPPHSVVAGKTIAEWGVSWYQWTFKSSTNESPTLDPTGQWATNHQSGPVFFVAGFPVAEFGGKLTRQYTISEDKFILLPLLEVHAENIDVPPPGFSIPELRAIVHSYFEPPP